MLEEKSPGGTSLQRQLSGNTPSVMCSGLALDPWLIRSRCTWRSSIPHTIGSFSRAKSAHDLASRFAVRRLLFKPHTYKPGVFPFAMERNLPRRHIQGRDQRSLHFGFLLISWVMEVAHKRDGQDWVAGCDSSISDRR